MIGLDKAKVVAFVHAKGTSERLPGKNLRVLGDRPLFCHAIRNALEAELVDAVVIDSENDEILRIGKEHGAIPLRRPTRLATNRTSGDDLACWQASNVSAAETLVQVVPTSPFLRPSSIDSAVRNIQHTEEGSAFAARIVDEPMFHNESKRWWTVQTLGTRETTGLYAVRVAYALRTRKRWNPNDAWPVYVSAIEAIDINSEEDWELAELVWKGMQC